MLHVVHDLTVQVAQDGDARVHLVVDSETQTHAHVLADVQPVQVVPEALADPVLADLSTTTLGECLRNRASQSRVCSVRQNQPGQSNH